MTKKPISNIGASVQQRLLNLRDKTGEDFNALVTQFAIERFLYRLSQSSLADRVVLKGAMLFRVWSGSLHRPTKDVDLLGFGEATTAAVAAMIRQIITTAVEDDGILFNADSVKTEEIRENQEYGGIRATFTATLDKAVIPLQVDVGFGDAITPAAEYRSYPVLVGMTAPRLRMYPVETVVAEKLEAAVKLGMINSRMKDFYDLLVIFRQYPCDSRLLTRAVAETFARRGTPLPRTVPPGLSDEFGSDPAAKRLWREFLTRMQLANEPTDFAAVIRTIRERLWPTIEAAGKQALAPMRGSST
ncbi:MAG: nucleotidyl transferase AbiEii/AbiGii toxin family protein [Planctomycetota bacterium]